MNYNFFKHIIFKLNPELMHDFSIDLLSNYPSQIASLFSQTKVDLKYSLRLNCGLEIPFPVGLAAGLDKNAAAINFFTSLYFGSVEIGTVTPSPQVGNPKPRLFRMISEKSLLNRMGFNSLGMQIVLNNLKNAHKNNKIIGVNLGKNKTTDNLSAYKDYQALYKNLADYGDYLVINISSPNTPKLRDLQSRDNLNCLLNGLKKERNKNNKPLFLKISPDLSSDQLDDIIQVAFDYQLAGLIIGNTSVMAEKGRGGVSGNLIKERSKKIRKEVFERIGKNTTLDIIGVGGIDSFNDLYDFWKMGGKVVQIYTSFIYQGPVVLKKIKDHIDIMLNDLQLNNLEEMVDSINNIERH